MSVTKRFTLGAFAILLSVFIGTKVYPIVHGPKIETATIHDGTTMETALLPLTGIAKYTKDLVINGNPIATAPNGSFNDNILLSPGYNVITMQAIDRFGKKSIKNYEIVLHENDNGSFTANVPPYFDGI